MQEEGCYWSMVDGKYVKPSTVEFLLRIMLEVYVFWFQSHVKPEVG